RALERSASDARARCAARGLPVCHPRLPRRQRLRVHQPHRGQALGKLCIEFTKSRPRHSNDNALAETKNGAIVRKHLGYAHIPQRFAARVNAFCQEHLNPYVNFHRPSFFPETITDAKGKTRKRYRFEHMMTHYEKLKSLPQPHGFLKLGVSFEQLDRLALSTSDNEAAQRLNEARTRLFQSIHRRPKHAA